VPALHANEPMLQQRPECQPLPGRSIPLPLRLESGSHPEDAMCVALDLINAWAAVHVDGSAPVWPANVTVVGQRRHKKRPSRWHQF
jgi:hypothetical protein